MQFDTFWGPIHEAFIGNQFATERRPQAVRGATRRGRSPRVAAGPLASRPVPSRRGRSPRNGFATNASWMSAQNAVRYVLGTDPRGVHRKPVRHGTAWAAVRGARRAGPRAWTEVRPAWRASSAA